MGSTQGRQGARGQGHSGGALRGAHVQGNGDFCSPAHLYLCSLRLLRELLFFKHRQFYDEGASPGGSDKQGQTALAVRDAETAAGGRGNGGMVGQRPQDDRSGSHTKSPVVPGSNSDTRTCLEVTTGCHRAKAS